MNNPQTEVVRVGDSGARIVSVTRERIDYIDMAGDSRFIDLDACARAWGQARSSNRTDFVPLPGTTEQTVVTWNSRCVGLRGALDNPCWASFMNERNTRFEFDSVEALYKELLDRLRNVGW